MRKLVYFSVAVLVLLMSACRQKKHDAAYYEMMVDSIRKAEQVKAMQRQAGLSDEDPLETFFRKLSHRPLPIRSEGEHWERIGRFTKVPRPLNEYFGYPSDADLRVLALPKAGTHEVVLTLEMQDSITPVLYLYTMDDKHRTIDQLCIYEERAEDRATDFGKTSMEYYITSDYEITLLKFYLSHEATKPQLEESRRYGIDKAGRFEERIIEL